MCSCGRLRREGADWRDSEAREEVYSSSSLKKFPGRGRAGWRADGRTWLARKETEITSVHRFLAIRFLRSRIVHVNFFVETILITFCPSLSLWPRPQPTASVHPSIHARNMQSALIKAAAAVVRCGRRRCSAAPGLRLCLRGDCPDLALVRQVCLGETSLAESLSVRRTYVS